MSCVGVMVNCMGMERWSKIVNSKFLLSGRIFALVVYGIASGFHFNMIQIENLLFSYSYYHSTILFPSSTPSEASISQ